MIHVLHRSWPAVGLVTLVLCVAGCGDSVSAPEDPGGEDPVTGLTGLVSIGSGMEHTCVVNDQGRVFCWGSNTMGQLGVGNFGPAPDTLPLQVAQGGQMFSSVQGGADHTCALTPTREIWCWGSDARRQLGYMTSEAMETCQGVSCLPFPRSVIDGTRFGTYTTGYGYTCVGTSLGTLMCWGDNRMGQSGSGGLLPQHDFAWPVTGQHFGRLLVAGDAHTCVVEMEGATLCWGDNQYGQLGMTGECGEYEGVCPTPRLVEGTPLFTGLAAGGGHSCGWDAAGTASCWGRGSDGALGDGTTTAHPTPTLVATSVRFSHISAGGRHSCGISTSGEIYCWGANDRGQLGLGSGGSAQATTPTRIEGSQTFSDVSAGKNHTCAITTAGSAYCWGANDRGQLGNGTTTDRFAPGPVSGVGG